VFVVVDVDFFQKKKKKKKKKNRKTEKREKRESSFIFQVSRFRN